MSSSSRASSELGTSPNAAARCQTISDKPVVNPGTEPAGSSPSLGRSALETLALRALVFGMAVAFNVAVSRTLGPDGRGQYALATLSAVTVAALAKLGLEHANVYLFGSLRTEPSRLARQNTFVSLAAGLPGAAALMVTPLLIPSLFRDLPLGYLGLAAATIPFLIHSQLAAGLQTMRGVVTWQFRAALVGILVQLGLVGALLASGGLDVLSALVANLVGDVVGWCLLVSRDAPSTLRVKIDVPLLKATLRYSLIVHVGLVLLFFQTRVTLFIVELTLGTTSLGLYSVAVLIAESLTLAADSLAITLLPRQTIGTLATSAAMSLRAARIGALLTVAAGATLAAFGQPVIVLTFGPEFQSSYAPLLVLLPGAVFLAVQRFCGPPTLRANQPARMAAIHGLGVLINAFLTVLWVGPLGLLGAAASTTISYAVTSLLFVRWVVRLARERSLQL